MITRNMHFHHKIRKKSLNLPQIFVFLNYRKTFLGLKNEFEQANVNEPLAFVSLIFFLYNVGGGGVTFNRFANVKCPVNASFFFFFFFFFFGVVFSTKELKTAFSLTQHG